MRAITVQCHDCGTVVAGNVLARRRVMDCPGPGCGNVLRFDDLPESDRQVLVDRAE